MGVKSTAAAARGLFAIIGLLLFTSSAAPSLTVVYSASLSGNLDRLAVRAAWLKALPERRDALIVDSGDILAGTGDPVRSREILEVCAELGYDAIAIGGREIADGIEVLPDYRDRFKLFCQNLAICSSQHCLFLTPEPFLIEKAGEKIGLIALLNPHALAAYPKQATQDAKLVPPDLLAGSLVDQLDGQGAEWVILLYHGPVKEAEMLARKVHGIHLIVVAGEQKLLPPRKVGGTLLVSPGEGGNRLGILELNRDGRGRIRYSHRFQVFRDGIDPADPEVLRRIAWLR